MARYSEDYANLLEKRNARGSSIRKAASKAGAYDRIISDKYRLMRDEIYNICLLLGCPDEHMKISEVIDMSGYRWTTTKDTITIMAGGEEAHTDRLVPFFAGIAELDEFESTVVAAVESDVKQSKIILYILDKKGEL